MTGGSRLAGLHVLVVDDNVDSCEILEALLRAGGAAVTCTASAAEALAVFDRNKHHVVISDLSMPEVDGFRLFDELRRRADGQPLAVVAMSGHVQPEIVQAALAAGFSCFLRKPFDVSELYEALIRAAGTAGRSLED
jgi:CheY-like chemotaxis protein